jgi:hypothetical protein
MNAGGADDDRPDAEGDEDESGDDAGEAERAWHD